MTGAKASLRALGIHVPDILVPKHTCDLKRWAVVACDQYTSEPEYWQKVDDFVKDAPSSLRLIFPEVYLDQIQPERRIAAINATMRSYLERDLFDTYEESFFLVHRTFNKNPGRWGLLIALDLEQYDYAKDSRTLIRATEGTILSRIPPRKEIRKDALLELPHILVLIDDVQKTVIEPLILMHEQLPKVYETELMMGGGTVQAYRVQREEVLSKISRAFHHLFDRLDPENPLLFAMGDGNHSLATAKSCWEDKKMTLSDAQRENHPARFALVEIENIYDPALEFEPIHRVLFNMDNEQFFNQLHHHCSSYKVRSVHDLKEIEQALAITDMIQRFGYVDEHGMAVVEIEHGVASIVAGTLQAVIDSSKVHVDYIHGSDVTLKLGTKPNNIGLFLPAIDKRSFFSTVVIDGALPRKTFSMGEAHEKRYYLEARRITM